MASSNLNRAYHIEREVAYQQGIEQYLCGCSRCHGLKAQTMIEVQRHYCLYGRHILLHKPLLMNANSNVEDSSISPTNANSNVKESSIGPEEGNFPTDDALPRDEAADMDWGQAPDAANNNPPTTANLQAMAQNYFACVDEIHNDAVNADDIAVEFEDLSAAEEEADNTTLLETLL